VRADRDVEADPRPINLFVPWAAGSATDQITRIAATVLESALGQTIVIINQPGASGAIGTQSTLTAARDGYTWTEAPCRILAPTRRSARCTRASATGISI
jgi:tripartite-type tricarboxylate transporter receptor subunit TctC